MFYLARSLKYDQDIAKYWVYDCEPWVKVTRDSEPLRVRYISDLRQVENTRSYAQYMNNNGRITPSDWTSDPLNQPLPRLPLTGANVAPMGPAPTAIQNPPPAQPPDLMEEDVHQPAPGGAAGLLQPLVQPTAQQLTTDPQGPS